MLWCCHDRRHVDHVHHVWLHWICAILSVESTFTVEGNVPIVPDEDVVLSETPTPLPAALKANWAPFVIDRDVDELAQFLKSCYVEDHSNLFRLWYSPANLRWALCPPGWRDEWHVAIRRYADGQSTDDVPTGQLVGFISAVPCVARIYGTCVCIAQGDHPARAWLCRCVCERVV